MNLIFARAEVEFNLGISKKECKRCCADKTNVTDTVWEGGISGAAEAWGGTYAFNADLGFARASGNAGIILHANATVSGTGVWQTDKCNGKNTLEGKVCGSVSGTLGVGGGVWAEVDGGWWEFNVGGMIMGSFTLSGQGCFDSALNFSGQINLCGQITANVGLGWYGNLTFTLWQGCTQLL
jgi:hypothetical protein